jgi:putative peptide chain release factor H
MSSVYLHVTAGNGPVECRIALADLIRRIPKEVKKLGVRADVSEGRDPDGHGPMSAVIALEGDGAEVAAAGYVGTIRYVFKSPVRKGHQRQNWFVGVSRIADPSATDTPDIDPRDVKFETLRAGGPGGQHQNTTDSAVRAIHVPTGAVALSRDERSQHRNKATALKRLGGILHLLANREAEQRKKDVFQINKELERGNAVRKILL